MNTRFLCTEVVGQKLTQLFIRTKNDIGSNGTSIVDTTLSPALSDVHVSLMPRLVRYLLVGQMLGSLSPLAGVP